MEKLIGLGYLRVSGKGQVGSDRDGFVRQAEAIDQYAQANGIEVIAYYYEPICGATSGEDRAGWIAMVDALQKKEAQIGIVERLDRLARDLMVQEHIIADAKTRGIELRSASEPDMCSTDPSRVLMRQIMGAINQYDKSMLVLKMKVAKQRLRLKGIRCEGAHPYGSHPDRPYEKPWIDRAKILRATMTLREVAAILTTEGAPLRHPASRWSPNQVRRLVIR